MRTARLEGAGLRLEGLMSGGGGICIVKSNASWVMVTWDPREQTDTSENITLF